ncbi:hypothetical protein [Nocardia salmonicida]|uniref:hypothetical protein n=1 Tax=Nocardia salmonicida TaxID=53431 RepID=UPI0020D27EEB|nr:hypothetical protein [Nocardia salmonicida]
MEPLAGERIAVQWCDEVDPGVGLDRFDGAVLAVENNAAAVDSGSGRACPHGETDRDGRCHRDHPERAWCKVT